MPPAAQQQAFAAFMEYNTALANSGVLRAGEQLQPTMTATTVRVRDGKLQTFDGPFAETKEQLGGTYVIEVPTLDEAIAWAAKCPAAFGGSIEIRPLQGTAGQ
jgi:hypothetical protein